MRNFLYVFLCIIITFVNYDSKATEHLDEEIRIVLPIQVCNYLNHLPKINREISDPSVIQEKAKKIVTFLKEFYPQRNKSDEYLGELVGEEKFIHKIQVYLQQSRMISMHLCGFPFKSTNAEKKVLGSSVDMAEFVSILTLHHICSEISLMHPAGAKITIISDGIVFKDILGISDHIFYNYQNSLKRLIAPFNRYIEFICPNNVEFRSFREKNKNVSIPINQEILNDMVLFAQEELDCERWKFAPYAVKPLMDATRDLTGESLARFLIVESTYFSKFREQHLLTNISEFVHLNVHPHKDISYRCSLAPFYGASGTPWHLMPVFTAQTIILEKKIREMQLHKKTHPEPKIVPKSEDSLLGQSGLQNLRYVFYLEEKKKYNEDLLQRVQRFTFNGVELPYFLR